MRFQQQEEAPEYIEGKTDYSNWEKQAMADELLREDTRRELCRACLADEKTSYGEETGKIESRPLETKDGTAVTDEDGKQIYGDFPEFECEEKHTWFLGEGKARGIDGKNPILFEEHIQNRRKREIFTQVGIPDPSIVQGIYNRSHPAGRKINSPEQRRKNGASYFR